MTTSNEHNNAPAVLEQELSALLTTSLPYMTPVGRARLGQDIAQLYSSVSAPAVPQGWAIKFEGNDISVSNDHMGCIVPHTETVDRKMPSEVLHALCRDLLAATPAGPAVQVYQLAKLGGPTETAWIDVTQEVYEDAGFYKDDFKRRILSATPATAPAQEIDKSVADAEIKAMYVESQGSDKGWLGIEGSYFIGGVVAARKQKAATAPAQGEPLGHFRVEPFGWTDCAKDDEGAIALYERPQEVGLTDEEITQVCSGIYLSDYPHGSTSYDIALARAIIAALRAKGGKHV